MNHTPFCKTARALISAMASSLIASFIFLLPSVIFAAERMYFVSLVDPNIQGGTQVVLEWGPFEGNIPSEIRQFKIYRSVNSGGYDLLSQIDYATAGVQTIMDFVSGYFNETDKANLLLTLQEISKSRSPEGPDINEDNYASFIHSIIDSTSAFHDPLQRMLLTRFHPAVARAAGLAWIDNDVVPGSAYQYLLTAVTDTGESLPIGKTEPVDPGTLTLLPAPTGLKQVRAAGCSDIRRNLDDVRVHLSWDIPSQPEAIGLNILIYGYDLFWSETDQGVIDFSTGIPAGLHKVNTKPIVISGEGPAEGKDGFMARDSGESHTYGPGWQRGQTFFYYVAARNLAGRYSLSSAPIEATVVDAQPPAVPWRVHTEEFSDTASGSDPVPRLALIWDQINPVNYIRYFETDRSICSADDSSVCMADSDESCGVTGSVRCVDLDALQYHILRFASPADAAAWGTDTDHDFWPDQIEITHGTDPCDNSSYPFNTRPPELIATIGQEDSNHHRDLADKYRQMIYVDTAIDKNSYDQVYYYKILAEDSNGNLSPLSPPARGVLHDRRQPGVTAQIQVRDCDNFTAQYVNTQEYRSNDTAEILTLVDLTGKVSRFTLTRYCQGTTHMIPPYETILSGRMQNGFAHISSHDFDPENCTGCSGGATVGYSISFQDDRGIVIAVSDPGDIQSLCNGYTGAIVVDGTCFWTATAPGMVARGPVKICTNLEQGQTARIYYKTGDKMSPVETVVYEPDPDSNNQSCMVIENMAGIVTSDLCMGIRVFSKNHVGSGMTYFDCLEIVSEEATSPTPPIIQGVYSQETSTLEPYFELHWSAPMEGQAAFVISMTGTSGTKNTTVFPETRNSSGQFSTTIPLDPVSDLNQEWCVKMKTISTSMQTSDWSQETCASWQVSEPENLAWPQMKEPVETGSIKAFFINEGPTLIGRPALMLSSNMSAMLSAIPRNYVTGACLDEVPVCDGTGVCIDQISDNGTVYDEPVNFSNALAGNYVHALVTTKNFILYRQEQGNDFVQVGPRVDGFDFIRKMIWIEPLTHMGHWETYYQLRDPFYFLRRFEEGAIGGDDPETGAGVSPSEHTGTRMIFLDRYPYAAGSTIRYKLVFLDPKTSEPETVKTSNWVTLP